MIETASWSRPPASGLRRKKAAEKYSTLPDESSIGRSPLTRNSRRERKRVSSAKRPLVRPSRSPIWSQIQNVEPSRMVSVGVESGMPPVSP
jgi:hypothetical protein